MAETQSIPGDDAYLFPFEKGDRFASKVTIKITGMKTSETIDPHIKRRGGSGRGNPGANNGGSRKSNTFNPSSRRSSDFLPPKRVSQDKSAPTRVSATVVSCAELLVLQALQVLPHTAHSSLEARGLHVVATTAVPRAQGHIHCC